MRLIKKVLNPNDVLDFMTSFDLAVKRQAFEEVAEEKYIPKLYVGENSQYKANIQNDKYDRPILTFNLEKRGPASMSQTEFFKAPHQHGFFDKKELAGGENRYVQRKDNKIKMTVRTKTLKEREFLITFLERVCDLQPHVLTSSKLQIEETSVREHMQGDFYIFDFTINIRTSIFISERDDAIMNKAEISYKSAICQNFSLTEHKCIKAGAQKQSEASDLKCYSTDFCSDYVPKIQIKINV